MADDNTLFHVDVIVVDGISIAFEDSTASISGAAGFKNDVKLSGSGDDYTSRSRVGRMLKAKLQWTGKMKPETYAGMSGVQIAMRDSVTGAKVLAPKATFGEMGDLGAGTVDISFHLTAPLQYL